MSHTEQESASDALKRHFAQRVTNQMRSLISRWRIVSEHPLTPEVINDLGVAAKKLQEQAHKFNAHDQASQSNEILSLLNQAQDQLPEISPSLISLLNKE
ncbi:MAG: hypothetical protein ACJA1X_001528, partial [Bermanella sp.]